jgi:hypothetical protein
MLGVRIKIYLNLCAIYVRTHARMFACIPSPEMLFIADTVQKNDVS